MAVDRTAFRTRIASILEAECDWLEAPYEDGSPTSFQPQSCTIRDLLVPHPKYASRLTYYLEQQMDATELTFNHFRHRLTRIPELLSAEKAVIEGITSFLAEEKPEEAPTTASRHMSNDQKMQKLDGLKAKKPRARAEKPPLTLQQLRNMVEQIEFKNKPAQDLLICAIQLKEELEREKVDKQAFERLGGSLMRLSALTDGSAADFKVNEELQGMQANLQKLLDSQRKKEHIAAFPRDGYTFVLEEAIQPSHERAAICSPTLNRLVDDVRALVHDFAPPRPPRPALALA